MLLLMVHTLFSSVNFPYTHFATRNITADTLFPIIWEAVEHLEVCGLNVIAFTSDGASANRKFYQMHRSNNKEVAYKTEILIVKVTIFSLLAMYQNSLNCWSNYFGHKESRALWVSLDRVCRCISV